MAGISQVGDAEQSEIDACPMTSQTVAGASKARAFEGWDPLQAEVVQAQSESRVLVTAGPGTGKTAVACARVAHLIRFACVQPSRIWLISFTRTAVKEMRDRIAMSLADEGGADAVKIATLDAHAWALHSGFDNKAAISGTHEENIERVLEMICQDRGVADYLAQVEHLVVDEAQDIVGVRAALVEALVDALPEGCGITVFADEAQAIYGFADDEPRQREQQPAKLLDRLRSPDRQFIERSLTSVYRTDSPSLLHLFTATRNRVLSMAASEEKLRVVREEVRALAAGELDSIVANHGIGGRQDLFVLYRRRVDALMASSYLSGSGVEHRLRMPGLPNSIHGWVGACLADHVDSKLGELRFRVLWQENVNGTPLATTSCDEAWALLVEYAGDTPSLVGMRRLRDVLGRTQPPAPFTSPDLGHRGPVVGTIHAAKGREAETVHLMLPTSVRSKNADFDEEARVVFVGATRARRDLLVGFVPSARADKTSRARVWRRAGQRVQIQIGKAGDVTASSLASRSLFNDEADVRATQHCIRGTSGLSVRANATSDPERDWTYRLRLDGDGGDLGYLSPAVNYDMFEIRRATGNKRPRAALPYTLQHLHVIGIRTIVLRSDSQEMSALHEPWSSSGILLAPIVVGFTTVTL